MKKRIFSLFLVGAMVLGLSSSVFAEGAVTEQENTPIVSASVASEIATEAAGLIGMAIQDPYNDRFGPGSYSIGSAIPAYVLEGDGVVEFEQAVYYPVYCDAEAVGIFTINGADTSVPTYSLGGDFIDNISDMVSENESQYSLVVAEHQIFAVTEDTTKEVIKYDAMPLTEEAVSTFSAQAQTGAPDEVEFVEIPNNEFTLIEYSVSDIASAVADLDLDTTHPETPSALTLPRSTRAWVAVGGVPRATQASGSYWCWAFSAWSIGEFMNGNPHGSAHDYKVESLVASTPKYDSQGNMIGYKKHGDSGSTTDIVRILSTKYGLGNAHTYTALDNAQMKKWLDADQPFAMQCNNTNGGDIGHIVTCYGYDGAYSPIKIGVMDSLAPDPNQYRYMTSPSSASGKDYKITSGGYTYVYNTTSTPTLWADVA